MRLGSAAGIAGLLGLFGRALPVEARNGDSVRAGHKTTANKPTLVEGSRSPALGVRNTSPEGEAVAVLGTSESPDGIAGVFVAGGGGLALRTRGRIQFAERSGVASVTGGADFVIPVSGGLSAESIVLATLQDHRAGVHVESASVLDAEEGLIVVRLNQALGEPGRVGWIVLG
ncbi:hypothetical protein BH23CHL8_BH23CHL8_30890 [soil metagenome]